MGAPISFELPAHLNAAAPPERRGIRRDRVRLMVSDRVTGHCVHTRFDRLGDFLKPGDLLVLNNSRTVPAVLTGEWIRHPNRIKKVEIRLAHRLDSCRWEALILGGEPRPGDRIRILRELEAEVHKAASPPLVKLRFSLSGPELIAALHQAGEPVRYEYVGKPWPLHDYQNVFSTVPGSVEPASAGRPFTWEMLLGLKRRGIGYAFVTLHTGLSDWPGVSGPPSPGQNCEPYFIPREAAERIHHTRNEGGRVIAVGTTVVRALESAAGSDGMLAERKGITCLHISRSRPPRVVDGLITGFHEPEASHLDLLTGFAEPSVLKRMYEEALREEYLWHEFGDVHLIL
ncbi:S-adenosylmethionine:tRNA ribosyltransferase-isomerase [Staphylospora marina]|uniref:S-adenosylmethionine:tRNA ribosyltransferase-isomerase n=1 Tax=Staphylospora marina TaxID=2490858 RepID=UPI000F5BB3B6|nr:S-adenosylmethionine:tRNA ribosyltransferase-isomerase [Staphylospora marina]